MGLLTDIYNTVARFFRAQDVQNDGDPSKAVAQNRLKLVLMQDRTNLTPKVLEQMRGEMIDLLSKYLEMDKDLLELNFEQEGDQVALMLSIPVIRAKDEDEIEKSMKASDKEEVESDETEESEESEETVESEENSEEIVAETEEESPKPRKRRTKKVSTPEDLGESQTEEVSNCEEVNENAEV